MSWSRLRAIFTIAGLGWLAASVSVRANEAGVVATIKPIHSLLASVMEGVSTPRLLIEGGASPHTFSLKPSDVRALSKAKVVFAVSQTVEPFMARVTRSLPKSVRVVELAKVPKLTLLKVRANEDFERHSHGKKGHGHGHGHGHSHGKAGATDGHIWLDPENAKLIAAHMAAELGKIDAANAARYKSNAERLAAALDALMASIATETKAVGGRPFIVFHDAYQYFEARFGLAAAGSISVSPDLAPSASRLKALRQKIAKLGAVCVFSEPQFEPRLVATVTEGTKARSDVLDPLGAALDPGPALYGELLRGMARSFTRCLGQPG